MNKNCFIIIIAVVVVLVILGMCTRGRRRRQRDNYEKKILPITIITPSYRIDNLDKLYKSIRFDLIDSWIIVYDGTKIKTNPNLFTDDPDAFAIGALYLSIVGPFYMLFAFGKTLYFASQGTGNMFFPIVGGISRLLVVSIFGILIISLDLNINYLFFTIGIAMSFVGLILCLNMFGPVWNPKKST